MPDAASLQNLHDIVLPASANGWPPAPGWFVLAGVLVLLLARMIRIRRRRWKADAYRRVALKELDQLNRRLREESNQSAVLRELPVLLKRTALAAWPREIVADLTGDPWLAFLDMTGGTTGFSQGHGRLLSKLPYIPSEKLGLMAGDRIAGLFQLSETWIKTHVVKETGNG